MTEPAYDANPFGTRISADDIVENLSFFDSWEDRYRYIIDLGRELPELPEDRRTDDRLVRGCQSQVWIDVGERSSQLSKKDRFSTMSSALMLVPKGLAS